MRPLIRDECGVDTQDQRYVIVGCQDVNHFGPEVAAGDKVDTEKATPGIVDLAKKTQYQHPNVRAKETLVAYGGDAFRSLMHPSGRLLERLAAMPRADMCVHLRLGDVEMHSASFHRCSAAQALPRRPSRPGCRAAAPGGHFSTRSRARARRD